MTKPAESAQVLPEIVAALDLLTQLRKDIHAHPELAYQEWRTADLVADTLSNWGITVERGLGTTGLVGIIKAGSSSRAIGLRADMDALPMQEHNQFPHASRYPGVMHACGHDGHTAMLLAAGYYLAQQQNFDGTVYLIFQPAEEGGGGADAMIKDGLFQRFAMQSVYGMHNWPGLKVGQFALSAGPVMASLSTFKIVIHGKGCHAAMPHLGLDPVPVAAQLILALQTIVSRNLNPIEAGLLSVTMLNAGEACNIIADQCQLQGTVRAFNSEVLALIKQRLYETSQHICLAHGMHCEIEFVSSYPATVNHAPEVAVSRQVLTELVGAENLLAQQPTMGAEDFAFMLQQLPGNYCFIGNGDGEHRNAGHGLGPCTLHNGSYDFNDQLLPLGASYWVKLVETCLKPV